MYAVLFPYLLGAALAAVTCYPAGSLGARREQDFFSAIITLVAVGFLGFPLQRADGLGLALELLVLVLVGVLVLLARRRTGHLLALAYLLHGAWDLGFLAGVVPGDKPVWLVQLCVPYDGLVAAYVAWRSAAWRRAPAAAAGE